VRQSLLWFPSVAAFAATGLLVTAVRPYYSDGPPPARTGGFGEGTCRECHKSEPLNAPGGILRIDSLPAEGYEPGHIYRLYVVMTKPGMGRGGYQLTVRADERNAKNVQAGSLALLDDRSQFSTMNFGPIQYLQHTKKGTALSAPDTSRWLFRWRAPEKGGPVVFHVAANAANNDNSEVGDYIYTAEFHIIPAP